jgi:DNA-binding beta-propeller fold protein YncE
MLQQNNDKQITVAGNLKIDLSPVAKKKGKFQPSCIAKHPLTNEWYIISSASKALLILNEEWKVKDHYLLDPSIFRQPEGLAFDAKGNMYVSNEGKLGKPNILLFSYKQL